MSTIIGLLCDAGNAILLAADTKVSWGTSTSNSGGSKVYELPLGLCAAIADDVSSSHVFMTELYKQLSQIVDDEFALDKAKLCMRKAGSYVFKWMRSEILIAEVGITDDEYLHDRKLRPAIRRKAERALNIARLPIEAIVAGYTAKHTIFLYTDGVSIIEQGSPGIFYGGSGGEKSRDWLNFRKQSVHCSTARSFVHISESLVFSGLDAFVGQRYGVFLLRKGMQAEQLQFTQPSTRASWVHEWANKVTPRPTDALDKHDEVRGFNEAFGLTLGRPNDP
jgi:hypothetical protein